MKISIFTPTHSPEYITECYGSLLSQSYQDWEWVIVVNSNDVDKNKKLIENMFKHDERVFVTVAPDSCYSEGRANIGALKNFACGQCVGDYLLELDHDDMLNHGALFDITQTIKDTDADFIYSDFCNFHPDWSCQVFNPKFGWESYPFTYKGMNLIAMSAINISPRALYQIHFAPNHVRVWKRSFYESIGGHDKSMLACDDHDLLCRTYIADANMVHIPKPLYLYRLQPDGANSYLEYNDYIQEVQQQLGNKYFYKMVDRWVDDQELLKIDLGGAYNSPEGYLSVDMAGDVNIKCDVTKKIPLPDNSVGIVRAYDFLEHISKEGYELEDADDGSGKVLKKTNPFIDLMNEIHRVLAPNGWFMSATPMGGTRSYYSDPTHVTGITSDVFERFCIKERQFYNRDITAKFQDTWVRESGDYVFADLMCLKGDRSKVAGECKI
ncbi:glycosyltransferase [bacterium]|nr:glycosyltransferase [bacterium]